MKPMDDGRAYDTVAFDVRDNTTMLFFAKTVADGDIGDYLLLMRTVDDNDDSVYIEINDEKFGGSNLIREADLTGNVLRLKLHEPAAELDGSSEIVLTWTESSHNRGSINAGALPVLGDMLVAAQA